MKNKYKEKRVSVLFITILGIMIFLGNVYVDAQKTEYASKYMLVGVDTLLYRCLEPDTILEEEKYPLILFLHGAGERGNDNENQLKHGAGLFLNPVNREKYPAYVVFPQCPKSEFGPFVNEPSRLDGTTFPLTPEVSPFIFQVKALLDKYLENPKVDKSRVYIIGLSMGAMGLYDLVCRFPDLFAAAIPICGAVNVERLPIANQVHFRIFHGEKDDVVPVDCSRAAYKVLKDSEAEVEYVELYGCSHISWYQAFNWPDFMDWLFRQKK